MTFGELLSRTVRVPKATLLHVYVMQLHAPTRKTSACKHPSTYICNRKDANIYIYIYIYI